MKVKNVELKWNVLYWNTNKNKVENYNIFSNDFKNNLYEKIKTKKITNYNELKEDINKWAMYHYWSKTECEMAIGPLWPKELKDLEKFEKIDMYRQIEMNLDRITEYIINKMEIEFK